MLGQVALVFKTFLRLTKREESSSKWNIWDKISVLKSSDMENSANIESAEVFVSMQRNNPEKKISIVTNCNRQCVFCFASFVVLLANIAAILMILRDLQMLDGETYRFSSSEMSKQRRSSKISLCIKMNNDVIDTNPASNLQCYSDMQFLRILFEMVVMANGRHLIQHSNIPSTAIQTTNQGYITGGSVIDPNNSECSKVTTETRFKNLITPSDGERNSLNFSRKGIYMVYVNLEFRSLDRCPSNPVLIRLRRKTGKTIFTDIVFHKEGLLVAQPKSYTSFVRLKAHDSLYFQISDTSTLEKDWKSNVVGGVMIS